MYVIMRYEDYLQLDHTFKCTLDTLDWFQNRSQAERIAKKLKAEVIPVSLLIKNKALVLDMKSRFHFDRCMKRASDEVAKWPEWKQNCLDNSSTVSIPREPITNLDSDCY